MGLHKSIGCACRSFPRHSTTSSLSLSLSLQGQYIKAVFKGGPADLAGMLDGDHILEVDGTDVKGMSHMKVCVQLC